MASRRKDAPIAQTYVLGFIKPLEYDRAIATPIVILENIAPQPKEEMQ
jgi:hypothetical protein